MYNRIPILLCAFRMAGLGSLLMLAACMTTTPSETAQLVNPSAPGTVVAPVNNQDNSDILYVTDRSPAPDPQGALSYGAERSRSISFGNAVVSFQPPAGATVTDVTETGSFPPTPYLLKRTAAGVGRDPNTINEHNKAVTALQAAVSDRLKHSKRKEVVIFVHGYANTFDDAVISTGKICRSLHDDFVCIALTWPAGGKKGVFFGYNVDRESGEYSVADLKKAIRTISETKGVERVHIVAHSRGTAVVVSVVQQLGIEAYSAKSSLADKYKIANIVLFAPDIDIDFATSKMFSVASDPDLPFGTNTNQLVALPQGFLHLTVYSSPNDKALGLSSRLFGSAIRLGQFSALKPAAGKAIAGPEGAHLGEIADFIEFEGHAGFIGHSYFLSDPLVNADLVALIAGRQKAGDPGRPIVEIQKPYWRISTAPGSLN